MRTLVAMALALVSFGMAVPALAQPAAPGTIAGTVSADGRPVAAARVTVSRDGVTTSAVTDAQGTYAFANLTAGTYTISVSKGGYDTDRETNIYLLAGSSLVVDVRLSASSFSSLQTIASVRTGRGGGVFNTSPAAIDVVSSQTFNSFGSTQV